MKNLFYYLIFLFLFSSCGSKEKIVYFQFDNPEQSETNKGYETIFKEDDLLQIVVSAQNLEASLPFNLPAVGFSLNSSSVAGTPLLQSYLIDGNGEIDFPVLGKIKLGGLTREKAINLFKAKISPEYILDPIINISISNFTVTILGEVNRPGSFTIPNERISILDAIGLAGDLTIAGKRHNISVVREENNKKVFYSLNLLSKEIINSPAFYLKQNDVVYVEPNHAKIQDSTFTRSTGLFISLASVLISLLTIITR